MQQESNQDFPNFGQAVVILLLLFGLQLLISAGFYDAGARFKPGDPKYGGVIVVLACGVVFSVLMTYKNMRYRDLFHPSPLPVVDTIRPLLFPLLLVAGSTVLVAIEIGNLLVSAFPMSREDIKMFERMYSGGIISVVTLCLIAPFIEEMLYRGIFLRSFLHSYGWVRSVVYASLLFGAAHLNIHQFVIAFLMGLLSGWLYVSTRSLWPPIIEHVTYNGVVLVYALNQPQSSMAKADAVVQVSPASLLLSIVILAIGCTWLWHRVSRVQRRIAESAV